MFRRTRRREDGRRLHAVQRDADQLAQLHQQVARLEHVLEQVLEASDEVIVDLRRAEREREQLKRRVAPAFAEAWSKSDGSPSTLDDFFGAGHVDKRARRWLLSSS